MWPCVEKKLGNNSPNIICLFACLLAILLFSVEQSDTVIDGGTTHHSQAYIITDRTFLPPPPVQQRSIIMDQTPILCQLTQGPYGQFGNSSGFNGTALTCLHAKLEDQDHSLRHLNRWDQGRCEEGGRHKPVSGTGDDCAFPVYYSFRSPPQKICSQEPVYETAKNGTAQESPGQLPNCTCVFNKL